MTTNSYATLLERCLRQRLLQPLDAELGRLVTRLDGDHDPLPGLATAIASRAVAQGHACIPLQHLGDVLAEAAPEGVAVPTLPTPDALRESLQQSTQCASSEDPLQVRKPLWLDAHGRLYLTRYARHEATVARVLGRLLATEAENDASEQNPTSPSSPSSPSSRRKPGSSVFASPTASTSNPDLRQGDGGLSKAPGIDRLRSHLHKYFRSDGDTVDWQAVAVLTGLVSPLTVITGGPGTGKTTTVLWLLLTLIEQAAQAGTPPPRIALAAPTGKAAARLGESLASRLADMDIDAAMREALPDTASTLHRLLGVRRGSTRFRHHHGHPLDADVVVVDEVSMVDLPLMARLLDALRPDTRLVLLGDRDQLASVEAGNVLAAICEAAGEGGVSTARAALIRQVLGVDVPARADAPACADAVVALQHSHRFGSDSGLGRLAAAVRDGQSDAVLDGLHADAFAQVTSVQTADTAAWVVAHGSDRFAALADADSPVEALRQAGQWRVLTALREGSSGCRDINAALERDLRRRLGVGAQARWYRGRLLLVTENDIDAGLFNGDVGIVWPDESDELAAWFATPDGVRAWPLSALPAHETGFAMTIHKSQGSEFDEVVIVLPRSNARVLGRELLYTALTRARQRVQLLADDAVLRHAIEHSTHRFSGLADRLEH